MLTIEKLKEFAKRYQTSDYNVVREYVQHLCLANLYRNREADGLLFKGGTALRIIYQSPRFSEDLDFTGRYYHYKEVEDLFLKMLIEVERTGIRIGIKEAKSTTGGYLGVLEYSMYDNTGNIFFEVSLRHPKKNKCEVTTIANDFTVSYSIVQMPAKELISEKIQALTDRAKPRDYYDLYFMLRHNALCKLIDKGSFVVVLKKLDKEKINFRKELSNLLPVSHHLILKNFKSVLRKEICSYI